MRKKRKSTSAKVSLDALIQQGKAHLAAGRYREAIEAYKQILKRERRPEWLQLLGNAYLMRARQLADKGMYKEAAALWENMTNLCGTQQNLDLYLSWLLESGRLVRAARMFAEAEQTFHQSPEGQRVAELLAGLLVSGRTDIAEALPANTALIQQHENIAGAVQAYCRGDDATLKEHLKRIPHRSPYRNLRLILQALPGVNTNPEASNALLARISADSPFFRLAAWVGATTSDEDHLLEAVTELNPAARGFVLTLKGWDAAHIRLANELLSKGDKRAASKALFKLIITNCEIFGAAETQRFCLALLPDYPEGKADYEKQFGILLPFEAERLAALTAERRGNISEAMLHWTQCVACLEQKKPSGEEALQAALILRHLADLAVQLSGGDPWDQNIQGYLVRSLALDPEDRDTYLKLMGMARERDDTKTHDRWIEQAVRRFPEDADILMAATVAAYRRGAFKKAAGFAQNLLKRDPINRSARNMLLSSHVAHARKQINAGKQALAAKELDAAKEFAQDDDQHGVVELNQGFLALRTDSQEKAMALLRQAYRRLGGGLVAHFRFLVDGQRLTIDHRTLSKYYNQIRVRPEEPVTSQDILRLVDFIDRYISDGVKEISDILEHVRGPLKAATNLNYSEKEMQGICAALHRADHYELLRDYAEAALKRWEHRPVFVYYSVFGRTKGWCDKMTPRESLELEQALDRAIDEDDHETIDKIEDYLGLPAFGPGPMPFLPPGPPPNLEEALDNLMDAFDLDSPDEVVDVLEEIIRKSGLPPPHRPKGKR